MSCLQFGTYPPLFFTVTLSVKNLVGDTKMCEFVIYEKNPQLNGGVWECDTTGKWQWLDKCCCCCHYFCVCPGLHHPSFLQRARCIGCDCSGHILLVEALWRTSLCTLVEVIKAASFLWSGFCFLYCKIAFIFAFDSHWMSLCVITVMFCWYSKYGTRSVLHDWYMYSTLSDKND